jgi:hypothetical protein
MVQTEARPLSLDYPVLDCHGAFRICTKGIPLQGDFITPLSQIPCRDAYDNHQAVAKNSTNIEAKFVKEEEKSFHIHLPCFMTCFIPGLVLAPLQQWVIRKGKGCICVDCTNGPTIAGLAYTSIPKPNVPNADECPSVFYQYSFAWHLQRLWQTCLTYPDDDILQHCDNIDAAFR